MVLLQDNNMDLLVDLVAGFVQGLSLSNMSVPVYMLFSLPYSPRFVWKILRNNSGPGICIYTKLETRPKMDENPGSDNYVRRKYQILYGWHD